LCGILLALAIYQKKDELRHWFLPFRP
jgi:hypothetical protein